MLPVKQQREQPLVRPPPSTVVSVSPERERSLAHTSPVRRTTVATERHRGTKNARRGSRMMTMVPNGVPPTIQEHGPTPSPGKAQSNLTVASQSGEARKEQTSKLKMTIIYTVIGVAFIGFLLGLFVLYRNEKRKREAEIAKLKKELRLAKDFQSRPQIQQNPTGFAADLPRWPSSRPRTIPGPRTIPEPQPKPVCFKDVRASDVTPPVASSPSVVSETKNTDKQEEGQSTQKDPPQTSTVSSTDSIVLSIPPALDPATGKTVIVPIQEEDETKTESDSGSDSESESDSDDESADETEPASSAVTASTP